MTLTNRKAYFGIHGWSGAGKTWLANTLPGPRLALEAEMGVFDTEAREDREVRIQVWDPKTDPVPTDLGPEDTVVVEMRGLALLRPIMQLLEAGNHPFESVILDSFSEMQDALKRELQSPGGVYDPNAIFDQQAWGRLKNHSGLLLRDLRELTWPSAKKPINIAVVFFSDNETVPATPLLEGGTRKQLPGWFDLLGFLYTGYDPDTEEEVRVLKIARDQSAEAKCRLHLVKKTYGKLIKNPDLTEILNTLNGGTHNEHQ